MDKDTHIQFNKRPYFKDEGFMHSSVINLKANEDKINRESKVEDKVVVNKRNLFSSAVNADK